MAQKYSLPRDKSVERRTLRYHSDISGKYNMKNSYVFISFITQLAYERFRLVYLDRVRKKVLGIAAGLHQKRHYAVHGRYCSHTSAFFSVAEFLFSGRCVCLVFFFFHSVISVPLLYVGMSQCTIDMADIFYYDFVKLSSDLMKITIFSTQNVYFVALLSALTLNSKEFFNFVILSCFFLCLG